MTSITRVLYLHQARARMTDYFFISMLYIYRVNERKEKISYFLESVHGILVYDLTKAQQSGLFVGWVFFLAFLEDRVDNLKSMTYMT